MAIALFSKSHIPMYSGFLRVILEIGNDYRNMSLFSICLIKARANKRDQNVSIRGGLAHRISKYYLNDELFKSYIETNSCY